MPSWSTQGGVDGNPTAPAADKVSRSARALRGKDFGATGQVAFPVRGAAKTDLVTADVWSDTEMRVRVPIWAAPGVISLAVLQARFEACFQNDHVYREGAVGVRQALARRGARLLYLPPYSPDLLPIEPCWSKVKTAPRRAKARTQNALDTAITHALTTVTGTDAYGRFVHCGDAVR